MTALPDLLSEFLGETRRHFTERPGVLPQRLVRHLDALTPAVAPRSLAPAAEPACAHLPHLLRDGAAETARLLTLVEGLTPRLAWERAPIEETPAGFHPGHAYCMIAGDGGFLPASRFMLGLFVIAPGMFYPNHAHAADELYYVLAGRAEWQVAGGAFAGFGPGALVSMPSLTPHAIRTGAEPVLILWAWFGDLYGSFVYVTD